MFERFTDRNRRVVVLAQEEARILNHNYVGTEHLLAGLAWEGEAIAAKVLSAFGITHETVRAQIVAAVGEGATPVHGHISFTPRGKKVFELALREALQLGHTWIGTEHLLLAIIREGEGVGATILRNLGVDMVKLRRKVIDATVESQRTTPPTGEAAQWHERARHEFALRDGGPNVVLIHRMVDENGRDSRDRAVVWADLATFPTLSGAEMVLRLLNKASG